MPSLWKEEIMNIDGTCDKELCNHQSDVDVYFFDGGEASLCAHCADMIPRKDIAQTVCQHGSDNLCLTLDDADKKV